MVICYILTDACLLLPAGRLADRVGHRRVFCLGLAVTGVALLGCGAAASFAWLLAARSVQGLGAALVFASAPALVTLGTPESLRQRALGWYNLAFGAAITLGPLLGGALVAVWGWRAVYLARAPLAAAALLLAWWWLPRAAAADRRPAATAPIADVRAFVVANAVNLVANAAHFFVWLLVPYYLLGLRGLPAAVGGLLFAAGTLATALAAPVGGWWADLWGARRLVPLALAAEALGLLLTSRLDGASAPIEIALALAVAGTGIGLFAVPNMHAVMSALPRARQGWAGSLVMLMRMAGIVLGTRLATWLHDAVGFRDAFGVAAAIAAGGALLSLVPPRRSVEPGTGRSTDG